MHLNPHLVAFLRLFLALLPFLFTTRPRPFSTTICLHLLGIGVVQYGLMFVPYILSYRYLEAHQVALLAASTPIYVTLFNDFFERKFNPAGLAAACLSLVGAGIILYQPSKAALLLSGFLLIETANLCFAFGQIIYRNFRKRHSHLHDKNLFGMIFLGSLLVPALSTSLFSGWSGIRSIGLTEGLCLLYLGPIASGLAFFFWNKGAVLVHSGTLAVLNNLKIPLAVFVSFFIFKETASLRRLILGSVVIGIALYLSEGRKSKTASS